MENMIRGIAALTLICFGLTGCVHISQVPFPRELIDQGPISSPVELQALQTREFEGDKKRLLSTIVTVFQNEGYLINQTDFDIGTVVAKTREETRGIRPTSTLINATPVFVYTDSIPSVSLGAPATVTSHRTLSVLVTELSPTKTRVRLTVIAHAKINLPIFNSHEDTDTNPERYQELFSKIQQALFLQKNLN
jgi:hypothetical protein